MTTRISVIANLALQTFQQSPLCNKPPCSSTKPSRGESCTVNSGSVSSESLNLKGPGSLDFLQTLCSSLHTLTLKDVGFKPWWVSDSSSNKAPVVYIHITENSVFSMGIFILRPGSRIPLHDHPGMFGVLRVLYGSLRCRSFTILGSYSNTKLFNSLRSNQALESDCNQTRTSFRQSPKYLAAQLHSDVVATPSSDSLVVSPAEGNLHEITATNGSAVFLDILAPPYNRYSGSRDCHFYEQISCPTESERCGDAVGKDTGQGDLQRSENGLTSDIDLSQLVYFKEISQPRDYWCDSVNYTGPPVK